jgi:sortase A
MRVRLWHFTRFLLLAFGLAALGYTAWVYCDEYWRQTSESQAFDRERAAAPASSSEPKQIRPHRADPFIARLSIARLHLAAMVEEGVDERTLRHAAGHIPSTALPGHIGNVGVAAHRDTLFRALRGIRKSDRIVISTLSADYAYEVTGMAIVGPADVSILAPTPGEKTLTLVTCYPFYFVGNSSRRFIVQARQIGEKPQSSSDE